MIRLLLTSLYVYTHCSFVKDRPQTVSVQIGHACGIKKGRKRWREEGWQEGKQGRKKGRMDGGEAGRKDGKGGRNAGWMERRDEGRNAGMEKGEKEGMKVD